MYNPPVIDLPDEENEATEQAENQTLDDGEKGNDEEIMYPIADRNSSTTTDEDVDQKIYEKKNHAKGKKLKNPLENVAEQIVHQHRRLMNKHQTLLAERRTILENISVLHDKLLNAWNDKMKSEHEYGNQFLRSIETSQAVWQSKLTTDSCRRSDLPSSSGRSESGDERLTQKNVRSKNKKVERLGRDLLESTEKRLKTLEEVASLINKELDEAKKECGLLDKELAETVIHLEEKEEILKILNGNEETEIASGKFPSRQMQSGRTNTNKTTHRSRPQSYTYKSEREIAEFVVEKRSTSAYPDYVNNSGSSNQKGTSSIRTSGRRSSYRTAPRSFPEEPIFFGNNASSRSSETESTDNNAPQTPTYQYSYFYGTRGMSSSSTVISLNHASVAPKKRGRPRKRPEIERVPVTVTEPAKKKRGRPRKYLRLELTRIPSTI